MRSAVSGLGTTGWALLFCWVPFVFGLRLLCRSSASKLVPSGIRSRFAWVRGVFLLDDSCWFTCYFWVDYNGVRREIGYRTVNIIHTAFAIYPWIVLVPDVFQPPLLLGLTTRWVVWNHRCLFNSWQCLICLFRRVAPAGWSVYRVVRVSAERSRCSLLWSLVFGSCDVQAWPSHEGTPLPRHISEIEEVGKLFANLERFRIGQSSLRVSFQDRALRHRHVEGSTLGEVPVLKTWIRSPAPTESDTARN